MLQNEHWVHHAQISCCCQPVYHKNEHKLIFKFNHIRRGKKKPVKINWFTYNYNKNSSSNSSRSNSSGGSGGGGGSGKNFI